MGAFGQEWSSSTRMIACLAVTIPFLYVIKSFSHNVVLNLTDSVNFNFGYYQDGPITKGEYVEFQFSHPLVREGETVRLTKRVACVSGDTLTTKGRYLYCNDRFLGEAIKETKSGKPLYPYVLNGLIPEGLVYLSGDSDTSFDSRYWGLMSTAQLNRVVPIW